MWSNNNKIWTHYHEGVLAADKDSAALLSRYMRYMLINRPYLSSVEVMDLQRYKKYKTPRKVAQAINERLSIPFVFLTFKN